MRWWFAASDSLVYAEHSTLTFEILGPDDPELACQSMYPQNSAATERVKLLKML